MIKKFTNLTLLLLLTLLSGGMLTAQTYNFDGLTAGATGNFTNGWVGSPTSGYSWRADNNGTPSSGTGPAVDHTLGNATGIYMYVEASSPASTGDTAVLTSPTINISSFANPGVEFWYHKAGTQMGDLFVDIYNGSSWIRGVDSIIGATQANENSPWLRRSIDLSAFTGSIQIRFRARYGSGFSGDMAIDDVSMTEIPPFDLGVSNIEALPSGYYQTPLGQATAFRFAGDLNNEGASTLSNAKMTVTVGTWQDSVTVASLNAGQDSTVSVGPWTPLSPGMYQALYEVQPSQTDTVQDNNRDTLSFVVSDTVFARSDSNFTGSLGIGAGTSGILGQYYVLNSPDTLTSVSFYLNNPTAGDTTWVTLHDFNGVPGNVIETSDTFIIAASGPQWVTLAFPCPQVLPADTFFLGVNETDQNVTLGTSTVHYMPNTTWVIFGANPWQPSEFYGFPVAYLLQANLGDPGMIPYAGMDGGDTVCVSGGMVNLSSLPDTFAMSTGTFVDNSSTGGLAGTMFDPSVPGAGVYSFGYGISDSCGLSDSAMFTIVVQPEVEAGQDTTVLTCDIDPDFDLFPLIVGADTGGTWVDVSASGALTGSNFSPGTAGAGTFDFYYIVDGAECTDDTAMVSVSVSICVGTEPALTQGLTIFPNPNQGRMKLIAPEWVGLDIQVSVMDLTGREIFNAKYFNTAGTFEVNLGDLPGGSYFLQAKSEKGTLLERLIIE